MSKRSAVANKVNEIRQQTGLTLYYQKDFLATKRRDIYKLFHDTDNVVLQEDQSIVAEKVLLVYSVGRADFLAALDNFAVGYNLSQRTLQTRIKAVMKEIQS